MTTPTLVHVPISDATQRDTWETLLDLDQRQPRGWTLIGAQMVALHGYEQGRASPRYSLDADVLVNVRVLRAGTLHFSKTLQDVGFTLDGVSPEGVGHRFRRADVSIDVLGPDGLSISTKERMLITVPPARTVSVPGGTQALDRSERVAVRVGEVDGYIPRPSLLGPARWPGARVSHMAGSRAAPLARASE